MVDKTEEGKRHFMETLSARGRDGFFVAKDRHTRLHGRLIRLLSATLGDGIWFATTGKLGIVQDLKRHPQMCVGFMDEHHALTVSGKGIVRGWGRRWPADILLSLPKDFDRRDLIFIQMFPEMGEYWNEDKVNKALELCQPELWEEAMRDEETNLKVDLHPYTEPYIEEQEPTEEELGKHVITNKDLEDANIVHLAPPQNVAPAVYGEKNAEPGLPLKPLPLAEEGFTVVKSATFVEQVP